MAALSKFLSYLYTITKLFFALLYLDVLNQFRSIIGLFTRRKNEPTTSTFLQLVDEAIPAVRYARRDSGAHSAECSVCLGQIGEGDSVREFRCKHVFHRDCVDNWLKSGRATCPVCRSRVLPDEVVTEFQNRQVGFDRRAGGDDMPLLMSFLHGSHRPYRYM